jgi:sugar-specific transcriptional regulator TrmB
MLLDVLQSLGLSKIEAEMYKTLLPLGDVPMATVTKTARRHPQVVYRLIDQLAAKGLATVSTQRHRKYVKAVDPKVLEQLQTTKLEKLRSALPELNALQHAPDGVEVHIMKGNEAIQAVRQRAFSELEAGEIYYILSFSGSHFFDTMEDQLERLETLRESRKVHKKMIGFESQRTNVERNQEHQRKYVEIRYLPEELPVPTSTNIFNNTTSIQIWSPEPIVILIESADVAQSYKDYFNVLWEMAKS